MEKDWFLDMCIIIYYVSEIKDKKVENSKKLVKNKGSKRFVVCYYIINENLPRWIKRQKIIIREVINRYRNNSYIIEESKKSKGLFEQDINKAKKLFRQLELVKNKETFLHNLQKNLILMEKKIEEFIKMFIDEIVIKKVDFELKSTLFTFIRNHSDAITIASGIQQHKEKELILITADKTHWTKENIQWVFDSKPKLAKKYPKIPRIRYIQDL